MTESGALLGKAYKAQQTTPHSTAQQMAYSKRMAAFVRAAESLGCCVLWSSPGREADDMIGSLAQGLLVGALMGNLRAHA